MEFRARRRQGSPHYTIYLGFGQDLSVGRPKEKSLVLVKVRGRDPGARLQVALARPDSALPAVGAMAVSDTAGERAA